MHDLSDLVTWPSDKNRFRRRFKALKPGLGAIAERCSRSEVTVIESGGRSHVSPFLNCIGRWFANRSSSKMDIQMQTGEQVHLCVV